MTPLLPSPDHYLYNLIAMTSSEAKRLWRRSIKEHFNCTCVYCGESYELHELTLDHVYPRCHGGNDIRNVVPACVKCNQDKGSTTNYIRWMRDRYGFNPDREQRISDFINNEPIRYSC